MKIVDYEIERAEEEMRDAEDRPNLYTDEFRKHKSYTVAGMAHIAQDILEAPTIDAVPVVRCKDCRHWCEMQNLTGACLRLCAIDGASWLGTDSTDYCSFAERRDDE